MTLEVTNVANSGEELIIGGTAVALEDGVTDLGGAEARVTVVGSTATVEITNLDLTQAQLEATLRDVSYANTATAPTGGVREIALTSIRDSGGSDNGGMDVAATDVRSSVLVRAGAQVGGSGEPLAVSTPEDAVYVLGREDFSAAIGMTNFEGVAFNLTDSDGDGTADYLDLNPTDPAISEAGRFGILFVDRDADNVVDAGEIIGIGGQEVVTAAQLDAGMVKFAGTRRHGRGGTNFRGGPRCHVLRQRHADTGGQSGTDQLCAGGPRRHGLDNVRRCRCRRRVGQ